MYRRGGLVALTAGLILASLFLVWPLHFQTGWIRTRDAVTKVHVECGVPFSILSSRTFGDEVRTPWIREQCVRKARTRLFDIAVFSVPLLVVGGLGIVRGPYRRVPLAELLRPLPKKQWWWRRFGG